MQGQGQRSRRAGPAKVLRRAGTGLTSYAFGATEEMTFFLSKVTHGVYF